MARGWGRPPGLMFVAGFAAAWALEGRVPLPIASGGVLRPWEVVIGASLLLAGAALYLSAIAALRRAGTALLPGEAASRLVTGGPFRFSRNPAYLGLAAVWCGIAALLDWGWPFLLLPAVVLGQQAFVIRFEEERLAGSFGEAYADYRRRVRRWL